MAASSIAAVPVTQCAKNSASFAGSQAELRVKQQSQTEQKLLHLFNPDIEPPTPQTFCLRNDAIGKKNDFDGVTPVSASLPFAPSTAMQGAG